MDTDRGRDVLRDELDKSFQPDHEEEDSEGEYSEEGEEDSLSERVNLNEEAAVEPSDPDDSPPEETCH